MEHETVRKLSLFIIFNRNKQISPFTEAKKLHTNANSIVKFGLGFLDLNWS
jgi:hypothetical protein